MDALLVVRLFGRTKGADLCAEHLDKAQGRIRQLIRGLLQVAGPSLLQHPLQVSLQVGPLTSVQQLSKLLQHTRVKARASKRAQGLKV